MDFFSIVLLVLLLSSIALQIFLRTKNGTESGLTAEINRLQEGMQRIENNLKEDFRISREEASRTGRENRDELNSSIRDFKKELTELRERLLKDLSDFSAKNNDLLEKIHRQVDQELKRFMEQAQTNA
ncbi:MAG: hypothetical protein RL021_1580, partial [Bacteroidota bacterium]